MGWVIFFISSVVISILCIPLKKWKCYLFAGIISLIVLYAIDSTLIKLGAFSYRYPNPLIGNLPTLYWLSGFLGGIILVHYYPAKKQLQFPYVLIVASLFLCLELFMAYLGYFNYLNWSPLNSFFLDIFGFLIVIWLWNWVDDLLF